MFALENLEAADGACYGLFCPAASGYHNEWSGKISRKQIEKLEACTALMRLREGKKHDACLA